MALSPARRSLLPRAPRTATVLRAAGDAMPTARLKQLLQEEDFAAAERESRAALEVLPELADVARLRGRALLSPLLDKLIDGGAVGKSDFEGAYEAYRLASVMNPDDSAEADEALGRIRDLCQKLEARDKDDLDEVIETTGKAVEEKALRFGRGARVVCNTGRNSEEPWEAGTVVALYHREEGWAPGEVVPYQVRLNDGTLIYAPFDADGCIRLRSGDDLDVDVVVVGAGAAGIGCAVSLTRAFGLDPARVRILERSKTVGASFRAWPKEMRFISPSFNQQGWTDSFDLNAVAQDTSPAYALHAQHPSGSQYADYLAALADDASLDIRLGTEVRRVEKLADGDFDVHVRAGGADNTIRTRFVVWAAGEFQYPSTSDIPGAAEHCIHNSKVESWAGLPGDERVVIGGYESGVDACVNLARAGKKVTVLASTPTWNVQTPDPSTELAPYTAERLREVMSPGFPGPTPELLAPLRVLRVEEASEGGGFNVVAA